MRTGLFVTPLDTVEEMQPLERSPLVTARPQPPHTVEAHPASKGPTVRSTLITTPLEPLREQVTPVALAVPWISQYDPTVVLHDGRGNLIATTWPEGTGHPAGTSPRDVACFAAANEMLRRAGARLDGGALDLAQTKDQRGRITVDPARMAQARAVLDGELEHHRPVLVGVMWPTPHFGLNHGTADHFVVITGRGVDDQGRVFYAFQDPAAGPSHPELGRDRRPQNRFFVDVASGLMFRPGVDRVPAWETQARLEVSTVRFNAAR